VSSSRRAILLVPSRKRLFVSAAAKEISVNNSVAGERFPTQQEQQLQSRIVGLFNNPARRFSQIVQVETFTDAITTPEALDRLLGISPGAVGV
jgi:hypothetical protein